MNRVHGHEVMHMMVNSREAFSRDTLRSAIHQNFGEETRFFTCSSDNMTADELISFLENKGKFQPIEGGFTTNPEKICNH